MTRDSPEVRAILWPLLGLNPDTDTLGAAMKRINALAAAVGAAPPPHPQLEWEEPDEQGDYVVTLVGVPNFGISGDGKTVHAALHVLGDALSIAFESDCKECAAEKLAVGKTDDDQMRGVVSAIWRVIKQMRESHVTTMSMVRAVLKEWADDLEAALPVQFARDVGDDAALAQDRAPANSVEKCADPVTPEVGQGGAVQAAPLSAAERITPQVDSVCEHGTAMDIHCCNCHSGFLFDADSCVCTFERPMMPDFWLCKTCGCLWRDNHDDTVSLASSKQTSCATCESQASKTACDPLFRNSAAEAERIGPRHSALEITEHFRDEEIIHSIKSFLEFGENEFGKSQQGYFSGSGFAARCLRFHLDKLVASRLPTQEGPRPSARNREEVRQFAEQWGQLTDRILVVFQAAQDLNAIRDELHLLYVETVDRLAASSRLPPQEGPRPSAPLKKTEESFTKTDAVKETQHEARCLDCGMPYEDFPMDLILPRSQWLTIHPSEGGLLCALCIVRRASKVPRATCMHGIIEIAPPEVAASSRLPRRADRKEP